MALVSFRGSFPAFQSSRNVSALKKVYPKSKRHCFLPIFRYFYVSLWVFGVSMVSMQLIPSAVVRRSQVRLRLLSSHAPFPSWPYFLLKGKRKNLGCILRPSLGLEHLAFTTHPPMVLRISLRSRPYFCFSDWWFLSHFAFIHSLSGVKWTARGRGGKEGRKDENEIDF